FIDAYKLGLVIECADGIHRRLYPRIFTYSADYPEKILLCSICKFGLFPAIQDLVSQSNLHKLGTASDCRTRIDNPRVDDAENRTVI
ncbi:hypothetical protein BDV93DRAFT_457696, partial [Ceratobasidium sp. AG-I]